MSQTSFDQLPTVFVSSSDLFGLVSKEVKKGRLRKLASRLYTKNLTDAPEEIIRRYLMRPT